MQRINITYRSSLLSLTFILLSLHVLAQVELYRNEIYSVKNGVSDPELVLTLDIDGDGDTDILFNSKDDDKLGWYENINGLVDFDRIHFISKSIQRVENIIPADLNNDGDVDLVVHQEGVSKYDFEYEQTVWLENLDRGQSFSSAKVLIGDINHRYGYPVDIDEDGDMDLISANEDGGIYTFENLDGKASYSEPTFFAPRNMRFSPGIQMEFYDYNQDGEKDIIIGGSGELVWYPSLKDSDGYGKADTIIEDKSSVFRLGDLDNDGYPEIIVSARNKNITICQFSSSSNNFSISEIPNTADTLYLTISLGDVDSDGLIDILGFAEHNYYSSGIPWDPGIDWMKNLGGLNFQKFERLTDLSHNVLSFQVVDWDNDGDNDIVSGSYYSLSTFENINGIGSLGPEKNISTRIRESEGLLPIELDNDSDLNFLTYFVWGEYILLHRTKDNKTYTDTISTYLDGYYDYNEVHLLDVDSDGDQDIIFDKSRADTIFSRTLLWMENINNSGTFSPPKLINADIEFSRYINDINTADIDQDGDTDIVFSTELSSNMFWIENLNGKGSYSSTQNLYWNGPTLNEFELRDIDQDGDIDIIGLEFSKIHIIDQVEPLIFGILYSYTDLSNEDHIDIADYDSDNDLDIVVSGQYGVFLIENINNFQSANERYLYHILDCTDAKFVDLDRDNDLDIVAISKTTDSIYWIDNLSETNEFELYELGHHVSDPIGLYIYDHAKDSLPDVLTYTLHNEIILFENAGINKNRLTSMALLNTDNDTCHASDILIGGLTLTAMGQNSAVSTITSDITPSNIYLESGDYKTMITSRLPDYFSAEPPLYESTYLSNIELDTAVFCISTDTTIVDLSISILPLDEVRPGFKTTYQVYLRNNGTFVQDGSTKINFDTSTLHLITTPDSSIITENGVIEIPYNNFHPLEEIIYYLIFEVARIPQVNLGDTARIVASLNALPNDITPENNISVSEEIIVGSYDPNDIRVLEGSKVPIEDVSEYLHYIIRFQNTGTAPAENVVVKNTLDKGLDWRTFHVLSSSHTMETMIMDSADISFTFNNINLPDSISNEPESHGFITYKIKPLPDTKLGDVISNSASIFFDFNPPIHTNTVTTEFIAPDELVSLSDILNIRVYLEGAYLSNGTMHTSLFDNNYLPGQTSTMLLSSPVDPQPYNKSPWYYTDTASLEYFPDTISAVDFMLVSILDSSYQATPSCRTLALLDATGQLLIPVQARCPLEDEKSYYVLIEHRNHLPVLHKEPITCCEKNIVDFTIMNSYRTLFSSGQKEIEPGRFAMFAGNADQNSFNQMDINFKDRSSMLLELGQHSGYFIGDFDLNGDVNAQDLNIFLSNIGIFSGIPFNR